MDETNNSEQPKDQPSPPAAEEAAAEGQQPSLSPQKPPDTQLPLSSEEDRSSPSMDTNNQDKVSPAAYLSERRPDMAKEGQGSYQHPWDSRQLADSSSLPSGLPLHPPTHGLMIGNTVLAQAPLLPPGYQHHSDPRAFGIAKLGGGFGAPFNMAPAASSGLNNSNRDQIWFRDREEKRGQVRYRDEDDEGEWEPRSPRKKKHRKRGKQAERWDQMFDRLVEFKRLHGHCLVPNRYVDDPSLGAWVSTQRRHYKILMSNDPDTTTPMTPERASRLESLGFQWATTDPRHVPWEIRFEQLLEYKKEHGDCVVPIGYKLNPKLSNWVSAQRQEYKLFRQGKKCRITAEKVQALNAVGFVWEAQRRGHKKNNSSKKESAAVDDALTSVLARLPGAAGRDFVGGRAPDNLSPEILRAIQSIPPDALLSHLLPLLAAQQQSNGLQQTSLSTAAARTMEDIVSQQNNKDTSAAAMPLIKPSLFPGPAHPLSQGMAKAVNSVNPTLFQAGGLGDLRLQDDIGLLALANGIMLAPSIVPYHEQLISKHVAQALRQETALDNTSINEAVEQIHGLIGRPNAADPAAVPTNALTLGRETAVAAAKQAPFTYFDQPTSSLIADRTNGILERQGANLSVSRNNMLDDGMLASLVAARREVGRELLTVPRPSLPFGSPAEEFPATHVERRDSAKSETSKFGVALQIGEAVKPEDLAMPQQIVDLDTARREPGRSPHTKNEHAFKEDEARKCEVAPLSLKPPAKPAFGGGSLRYGHHSSPSEGNDSDTETESDDSDSRSSPDAAADDTLRTVNSGALSTSHGARGSSPGTGMPQSDNDDGGGVFSDAEEDESVTAFLDATRGRRL